MHVTGDRMKPIQGPRSVTLKYDQSLCQVCNTTRTQPYDLAYDQLITWVLANEQTVLKFRMIDFAKVYDADWATAQTNLYKYFVKSFGCRLVAIGEPVPHDLVTLLPLNTFPTALRITFSVNEDTLLMRSADRNSFIGKGDLGRLESRSDPTIINGYVWSEHVSWFTIYHWYGDSPEEGRGSPWVADARCVYLGSVSTLTEEQRAELRAASAD